MAFGKFFKRLRESRLSIRTKLVLSLSSIAAILLVSLSISVMEYSGMSNYVSDLIADDISSINVANRLADMSNTYNLQILEVIGDETSLRVPAFDDEYFKSHCDSLRSSVPSNQVKPLADSVMYSYSAYMLTSLELEDVLQSDFIEGRHPHGGLVADHLEDLQVVGVAHVGQAVGHVDTADVVRDEVRHVVAHPGILHHGNRQGDQEDDGDGRKAQDEFRTHRQAVFPGPFEEFSEGHY